MSRNNKQKKSQSETSRRSFLTKLWIGLGFVAFAEFIAVAIAYLRPRKSVVRANDTGSIIIAGSVDKFSPDSVTAFVRGRFYLARLEDGGFLALSRTCTHLGCTVPWEEKDMKFVCPCHASAFDITGNVIDPPAPRALAIYPITIENNVIKVDTRKPIKRSAFLYEQVTYSKKKFDRITG